MNNLKYHGDLKVIMNIEYNNNGIGVVIKESDNDPDNRSYMLKIDNKKHEVLEVRSGKQKSIKSGSNRISANRKNLRITFVKTGRDLKILDENGLLIMDFRTERFIGSYLIGIYSNHNNIVKNIEYISNIADKWMLNTDNINTGRILFEKDSFEINNSDKNIEIEQYEIFLKKGEYYLNYEEMNSNIKSYVFHYNDNSIDDDYKNILDKDRKFELFEDSLINIKFKGTNGKIKNISINKNENENYISTNQFTKENINSYIRIKTDKLQKVTFYATIKELPSKNLIRKNDFYMFNNIMNTIEYDEYGEIYLGEEYYYEVIKKDSKIYVYNNKNDMVQEFSLNINHVLNMFKNISTNVRAITITRDNGEVDSPINKTHDSILIPKDKVAGPIIITDKYGNPFDISSSYRFKDEKFVFTNTERELFRADESIYLEKDFIYTTEAVSIYGILKGTKTNYSDLYTENTIPLEEYSEGHELISSSDYNISEYGRVKINKYILERYDKIVIDYMKNNSYSINEKDDSFYIDISSVDENIVCIYEESVKSGSIENFINKNIIPEEEGKYVVLSEED